jgi:hypothetical protein
MHGDNSVKSEILPSELHSTRHIKKSYEVFGPIFIDRSNKFQSGNDYILDYIYLLPFTSLPLLCAWSASVKKHALCEKHWWQVTYCRHQYRTNVMFHRRYKHKSYRVLHISFARRYKHKSYCV